MDEPAPRLRRLKRLSAKSSEEETVIKFEEEEDQQEESLAKSEDDDKEEHQEDEELRKYRIEISVKNGKRSKKDLESKRKKNDALKKMANSWRTPRAIQKIISQLSFEANFDLIGDACASEENAIFPFYYTEEIDAMQQAWFRLENVLHDKKYTAPRLVLCCDHAKDRPVSYWYINPPYGKNAQKHDITDWLRKCRLEAQKGVGVLALVPCINGEVSRWHHVLGVASEVFFIQGRLKYGDPVTGEENKPAQFGSMLIHWDPRKLCPKCGMGQPIETRMRLI